MQDTTKRILAIVAGVALIAVGYFGMQYLSGLKEPPPRRPDVVRAKSVRVMQLQPQNIPTTVEIQGRIAAFDKVALFSEVNGTMESSSRPFKVGTYFPKGSVLLRIDDEEARLNLQAQKSTLLNGIAQIMPDLKIDYPAAFPAWEQYLNEFDVDQPLAPLPEPQSSREKLFVSARNLYTQYYNIKSLEERLSKYTLYAPFSGVLTETNINLGAIVRVGQQLGSLMATGNYELVATVPLSELEYIRTGNRVELFSPDLDQSWTGTVRRISDQIDPGSQTVQVFVGVPGKDLREGMYLRGEVTARDVANAAEIDRQLIINQNEIYVVRDSTLQLLPVEVVKQTRNTAIIRGVDPAEQVIAEPVAGAFPGMKVRIAPTAVDTIRQMVDKQ
jgi:multidrug efflux pump subunit AcrA (membrane-fusion protein)